MRGVWHFPCKFPIKWLLRHVHVHFRLRRLAQNACPGPGAYGISPVNICTKWLLWHAPAHFDCAGSQKTRKLAQKSCQETSYRDLASRALMEILWRGLARRPPTDLQRSFAETWWREQRSEIFYRELEQRSYFEILHRDLLWRSLIERSLPKSCQDTSYRDPEQRSCQDTSYGDLVQGNS